MGYTSELETISCYIQFSPDNITLFNENIIRSKYLSIIKGIMDRYGLRFETPVASGMGGGADTLFDLLRFAWQNRDLVGFIYTLITGAYKVISQYVDNVFESAPKAIEPGIKLILSIGTSENIPSEEEIYIRKRLLTLKLISDILIKEFKNELPLFKVDQTVCVSLHRRNFYASFTLPSSQQNNFNNYRLTKLINRLLFIDNHNIGYLFSNLGLVIKNTVISNIGHKKSTKHKKFYLIFSANTIGDHLNKLLLKYK